MSQLMDHRSQIELLHNKASEGDIYSRFNFDKVRKQHRPRA